MLLKKICTDCIRGELERLFGSREREGKLKITFPFYGKGTGIRKLLWEGKGNKTKVICANSLEKNWGLGEVA